MLGERSPRRCRWQHGRRFRVAVGRRELRGADEAVEDVVLGVGDEPTSLIKVPQLSHCLCLNCSQHGAQTWSEHVPVAMRRRFDASRTPKFGLGGRF
jgi:hypothetical protein